MISINSLKYDDIELQRYWDFKIWFWEKRTQSLIVLSDRKLQHSINSKLTIFFSFNLNIERELKELTLYLFLTCLLNKKYQIFLFQFFNFLICLVFITPGILLGSLKKFGLAVWPAIGNIYTNVLFYYKDMIVATPERGEEGQPQ